MASIDDKTKTNGNTAKGDYRLPTDGPHRFVKKEVKSEKEKDQEPPYVVAIVKRDKVEDENKPSRPTSKYDPKELRAKAKTFLNNPNITPEQKDVLKEILGPDEVKTPT